MVHCSIVRFNNKQASNSEVTCFNLPKDSQRRKSWLVAISRDKGNLPTMFLFVQVTLKTNILIDNGIYKTDLFYTDRPIKRKLISTAIPTLSPHK